jgi:hypothetical protein
MRKIVVTFDTVGNSSVEAFGFTGGACLLATKTIEEAIGKVGNRTRKSDNDTTDSQQLVSR